MVPVDRSGEMFRRVNRRQLHQLMIACESGDESIYALQERWDDVEDNDELASVRSGRSSTSSVGSVGSMNSTVIMTHTAREGSAAQVAASAANDHFLLLDVRDDDAAFARFHIDGAVHYTPAMLRRDHFTPQLYKFKNAENKLIILYDTDETSRIALECCALFIQKGFTNIFLLTGGLKHFGEKYHSRIVGDAPPPPPRAASSSSSHGRSGSVSNRSQALAGAPMSGRPGASALMGSARPASSASQQQFRPSTGASSASQMQQGRSANAHPATSLSSHRGPSAPSGTHLGGGAYAQGRESPRDVLGRQQQQAQMSQPATPSSQQQQQHQRTRSTPSGAAASSSHISSRAFR